jgi:hypothetical protein
VAEKEDIVLDRDIGSTAAAPASATAATTAAEAAAATEAAAAGTGEACASARGLPLGYSAGSDVTESVTSPT